MRRFLLALLVLVLPLHALAQTAKQIVQYPAAGAVATTDRLLMQQGGVGTPFTHGTVAQILSGGLAASFSTLTASGAVTGAGSIIAANGGTTPVTIGDGLISVGASKSLSVQLATAGQSITLGAPGAGLGSALTVTANSNGNNAFGAAPNDVRVNNALTFSTARTPSTTYTLSGTVTPTAISGSGSTVTITFPAISGIVVPVGSSVTLSGVSPGGYNKAYTVATSTNTQVTATDTTTGTVTVLGSMAYKMLSPQILNLNSNWTGTPTAGSRFAPYRLFISGDTAKTDATGQGAAAVEISHAWSGAADGGKLGMQVSLSHTSATNDTGSQQHVVANLHAQSFFNAGGTGTGTASHGTFYGTNPQVRLGYGATYWRLVNTLGEIDLAVNATQRNITLGGTVTAGNTVTLTFASSDIVGSPVAVAYTLGASQTLPMVANNLAAAINGNTALRAARIGATAWEGSLKIYYFTHIAALTITPSVSGGATITAALGTLTEGASVDFKTMASFIRLPDDDAPGSAGSALMVFGSSYAPSPTGQFEMGIAFNGHPAYHASWSFTPSSTLIGSNLTSALGDLDKSGPIPSNLSRYGIDWQLVNFTQATDGRAFRSSNFGVGGEGNIYSGPAVIAPSSSGLSIDVSGKAASSVALQSGGGGGSGQIIGNYFPKDIGFDDYGGQYLVTGVNAGTGAVTTFTVLSPPSYSSGSAPSNPITVNGGSGRNWTVNATWPSAPALSLQASGGITNVGGDVKITDQSKTISIGTGVVVASPAATSGGFNTLIGHSAGKNVSSSATETTAVGYCSAGAGCRGGGAAGGTGMTGSENTHIGWYSGTQVTSGAFLTAVGVNTMGAETTGNNSVAIGTDAMRNSIGIVASVAIGTNAMRNGAATTTSIAIGQNALIGDETAPSTSVGSDMVAIGYTAMASATRTSLSTTIAIGTRAGNALQTGAAGVFIGHEAGKVATVANNMVGIGFQALVAASTGSDTVAVGRNAGGSITTAANDVFIGHFAGQGATGSNLVAVGSHSLEASGSTVNAVAVGHNAGKLWTGNGGLFLGPQVGSTTAATGNNVILIGTNSSTDTPASNTTNYMAIGGGSTPIMFATSTNATPAVSIPGSLSLGSGSLTVSAGSIGLTKITASAAAPGAGGGKIELVCGTNSGTAKLIAYAGTSTTAVTILDNIGASVTGC